MPTIPQRIASAFTILFGRYGGVTGMARVDGASEAFSWIKSVLGAN